MPASRPGSVAALLGALLAASGCAPERTTGGGDSPAPVQRGPVVSFSRAELSPPLAALPDDPTPAPADSLLQLPAATANFLGQGTTLEGCTFPNPAATCTSSGAPPYPSGAAGPNHYVQVVNGGIAIFNKSGTVLAASRKLNTLWSQYTGSAGNRCSVQNDGQANVLYDPAYPGHWLITQISLPNKDQNASPSFVCMAVSKTADPTGAYYLYDFPFAAVLDDYPQFGIWRSGYFASFNNFGATSLIGANVCAFDRGKMLGGQDASGQCFLIPGPVFGLLPATYQGVVYPTSGAPAPFLNVDTAAGRLNLWKFRADFTTPTNSTLTGPTAIPVDAFSPTCGTTAACVPQPSPGNALVPMSDRLMPPLVYRNFGTHESLVANHSVAAGSAGGVRWYELRSLLGTPTVFQQGTYAPADGSWRFMGSAGLDGGGNIALGFTLSSATINPSVAWTGRLARDPPGTMAQGETVIATGAGVETGTISAGVAANRWGAWSSMSVDPQDDCTFWYTSELYPANGVFNWDTRIAAFKFPGCGANDFSLAVSDGQDVPRGGSVDFTISTAVTKGSAETIGFGILDPRDGVTGVFNPPTVLAGGSTTLRVTASPTATLDVVGAQSWFFKVVGSSPSAVHMSDFVAIRVSDCKPTVTTCPAAYDCGLISNGCLGYISCGGDCPPPKTCGGGGTPNVCGGMGGTGGGGGAGGGGGGTGGRGGSSAGAGAGSGGRGGAGGSAEGGSAGGSTGAAGNGTGGGAATAGSAAGSNGRGGEAGAATGSAGAGGQAGSSPSTDSGCGCSTPGAQDRGSQLLGLGLACAALVRRARRPS